MSLLATPASAADDAFCQKYAYDAYNTAFDAPNEAGLVVLGAVIGGLTWFGYIDPNAAWVANCGFSGPRWSTNMDDHYNWCRSQDEATVNAEAAARDNEYEYCAVCISYVNVASSLENQAKADHCRIKGPNWPTSPNALLQFCLAQGHSDIKATVNWLQDQLNRGQKQIDACVANREQKRLSMRKPTYNVSRPAGVATKPDLGLAGKGINQDALDDPHCLRCKSSSKSVVRPGLLEGDQGGFSSQAPAASGPVPSAVPRAPTAIDR